MLIARHVRPAARGRYAALRQQKADRAAFAVSATDRAAAYLADTLDWLNLWQDNADCEQWPDDDFSAKQDHYGPQP